MANESTEELEIRTLTDSWVEAVRAANLADIEKNYAVDVVAYDAVKQLQFIGREAYTKHWEHCLTLCPPGDMIFDIKDLVIHADQKVAFSYCLTRCGGRDKEGNERSSWMRVTRGLLKINGQWLTMHEHFSSPFDMESGKILFDVQP